MTWVQDVNNDFTAMVCRAMGQLPSIARSYTDNEREREREEEFRREAGRSRGTLSYTDTMTAEPLRDWDLKFAHA